MSVIDFVVMEPEPTMPTSATPTSPSLARRGRIVAVAAVVVALAVGGVVGAAVRGSKTKIVTQTNTVTVTSIVTETSIVDQTPQSCLDAVKELGQTLAVAGAELGRLRDDAVKNGGGSPVDSLNAWLADILKSQTALNDSLPQGTDIQDCQASG